MVICGANSPAACVVTPSADAILASARERDLHVRGVERFHETPRAGVAGSVDGHAVVLGNSALFTDLGLSVESFGKWPERLQQRGEHVLFIAVDGRTAGFFGAVETALDRSVSADAKEDEMGASSPTSDRFPTATTDLPMVHPPESFELVDGDQFDLVLAHQ